MKAFFYSAVIALIAFAFLTLAWAGQNNRIYLTAETSNSVPEDRPSTNFNYQQKIYVVFEGFGIQKGQHTLEAFWNNPKGKQQEYTKYDFKASREKEVVWLWIELHPASGAKILRSIDPSFGMEDFIGKWIVTLYLDGKFLIEKVFYVNNGG